MGEKRTQSILFADVCGSTALFERLGDDDARSLIGNILDRLTSVARAEGGDVVKTIGDEVMCTLPTPGAAIEAAVQMQRAISQDPEFAKRRVAIRIGVHYGETLAEVDDVYGDAVNVASRMAGLAKREQIVATAATALAAEREDLETRSLGKIRVKGKLLPIETCDVLWQEDLGGVTVISQVVDVEEMEATLRPLILSHENQKLTLTEASPPIRLGRDPASEIVVDQDWVSRNHAKIEHRSGGYVVVDRSTNGSYVRSDGGETYRVHREEIRLRGRGVLSLGRAIDLAPAETLVHWQCDP